MDFREYIEDLDAALREAYCPDVEPSEPEQPVRVAPEVVIDKLFGLDTPLAIATMLREERVKGERRNGTKCPIANWLELMCPVAKEGGSWEVGTVGIKLILDDYEVEQWEATEAVRGFVRYFDGQDEAGMDYPAGFSDLVATDQYDWEDEDFG